MCLQVIAPHYFTFLLTILKSMMHNLYVTAYSKIELTHIDVTLTQINADVTCDELQN